MRGLAILLSFLAFSGTCWAQESRASIRGRVSDKTGAVLVEARVQALNLATNTAVSTVTNQEGNFDIPYLLPSLYRVTVETAGFKTSVRDSVELRVNDRLTLDFTLEVGDVTQSVVVTGEVPMLESATASVGMLIDERRVREMPIVGGNAYYLARLSPGVMSSGGRGNGQNPYDSGTATTTIIVNGTRSGSSEVLLDGLPNMFENQTAFSPPPDMVQEFKLHTSTYDASLGHAAGAVASVSVKSGANNLHGTAYYFDSRLRGRPWFLNRFLYDPNTGPVTPQKIQEASPNWLHQRWEAMLSGPVVLPRLYRGRNRTFWSFGSEGVFARRQPTFTGTVPTPEQRQGNFSALLRLGAQYQIYDPATIAAAPGGRFSRQPLPGNVIPAARMDPLAKKMLEFWPQPTGPGTSDARQNFFRVAVNERGYRSMMGRLDHNFSERHRFFLRLNYGRFWDRLQDLPTIAHGNSTRRTAYGLVLDDVYIFSPQLLLNVRYGVNSMNPRLLRFSQGFDLLSLGFPKSLVNEIGAKTNPAGMAFPEVVVDGGAYTNLGANGGNGRRVYYQTWAGTLTKMAGNHSIRAGGEFRLLRENGVDFGNVAPRLEFASTWTRGQLDTSPPAPIGQGLASLLLGIPSGGRIDSNASWAEQSKFMGWFIQDDWRLTRRLTLNLGLRYEYESPSTERFNRSIRGFDLQTPNPVEAQARANYARAPLAQVPVESFRVLGGLTFAGTQGQPRSLWGPDKNNFAPRIGLAFQLTPKTVLRAGYGIFYDLLGIDRRDVNQGGFNQPTNLIPSLDNGLTFLATLANPFPNALQVAPGAAGGFRTFLGRSASYFFEQPRNPYMQRWSFSIQRELPQRILIDLAYVGNRGTKLASNREQDAVPRQYLSTSRLRDQATINFLSEQVPNPFFGITDFDRTALGNVRVDRGQLLRPYPQFTGITASIPGGYSYYHSLQVLAEKRLSKGMTFQSSWTWSKFMEATGFLNPTDLIPEKVISDQDYPHRFVVSFIYELPFGRDRRLFGRARGVLNTLVSDWQIQGLYEGQSGQALGFGNAIFFGDLKDIPLPVSQRRAERWFNTEAGFDRDPRNQLASNIRFFPARFNGIRSDGINNFDLSLFKNFRIREGLKAQFRLESYNALNHVQFDGPNTNPASTAFGTVTQEKGHGQRQVTLGIKVMF